MARCLLPLYHGALFTRLTKLFPSRFFCPKQLLFLLARLKEALKSRIAILIFIFDFTPKYPLKTPKIKSYFNRGSTFQKLKTSIFEHFSEMQRFCHALTDKLTCPNLVTTITRIISIHSLLYACKYVQF